MDRYEEKCTWSLFSLVLTLKFPFRYRDYCQQVFPICLKVILLNRGLPSTLKINVVGSQGSGIYFSPGEEK